ncbi:MAG: hypothetical protein JNL58_17190 [Planctomyces sp.]|nr:hypothetical protein [Planctomyces sp.]
MLMSNFNLFNESHVNLNDLCEDFEDAWNSSHVPDVFEFLKRASTEDLEQAALELIPIDMERRWKKQQIPLELSSYLTAFSQALAPDALIELICSEFCIRNTYGDCISRTTILQQYGHLGKRLHDELEKASANLSFPFVSIMLNGVVASSVKLDRVVTAGRQNHLSQKPWSSSSAPDRHRLILCEASDPSLSRNQLEVIRVSPDTIRVKNTSSNRALAVRGCPPLDAGQSDLYRLPVFIHLGASRYLRVSQN